MRYRMTFLPCAAILLATPWAVADETEIFNRLDKNADGQLTQGEVAVDQTRLFNRLLRTSDTNEDGQLSKSEFVAGTTQEPEAASGPSVGGQSRRPQFDIEQFLARLDRNGDKKLSKDESPERMRENFDRIDQNADGFIDAAEFRRIAGAMRDRVNPNNRTPQPSPEGDRLDQIADRVFQQRDANNDGKISIDEIPQERRANYRRTLEQFDVDPDIGLNKQQFTRALGQLLRRDRQPQPQRDNPRRRPE